MRVWITGATGFVGRSLVAALLEAGHRVVVSSRNPAGAQGQLGDTVVVRSGDLHGAALARELAGCDAVINLAGEPVAGRRWTPAVERSVRSSRVDTTRSLVDALALAEPRPRVLISASAVGLYGDRGDEHVHVGSAPASRGLAGVVRAWEAEASRARALGMRVTMPRLGVIIGAGGGFLGSVLPVFRAGLGGPLGTGRQWVPWVHLDDVVAVLIRALEDERFDGPFDLVAPNPVRQRDLARTLGRVLGRPAWLPAPAPLLRLALGEGAGVLLDSARVTPMDLERRGYAFRHPTLEPALRAAVDGMP